MKKTLSLFSIIVILSCAAAKHHSYSIYFENNEKQLKGIINRSVLENDTTFAWFKENMNWGQANEEAVKILSKKADKFSLLIVGGTWCHDTKNLLPVLYRLIDKSHYPENKITLVMVDRKKQSTNNLPKQYNVTHTPTFIVLHDGKEVGRIVEYGKYGEIDKELGEIVNAIP